MPVPTACDANLIHGTSVSHILNIPVGKKLKKAPSDINIMNMTSIKDICDKYQNIFLLIMNRDSLAGRPFLRLV